MNLRARDDEPIVYLIPFRPNRRATSVRTSDWCVSRGMERTQFRALGWSVRYRRTMSKTGDMALAAAIVAVMAAFVASPVLLFLILWRLCT